jgi:putative hemolysin
MSSLDHYPDHVRTPGGCWLRYGTHVQTEAFTYSSPRDPLWKRWAMRAIEDLSGRRGLLPVYYRWRRDVAGKSPRMMGELLEMVGATIALDASAWPPVLPADAPLVIVANHPFGIGDGIALLALAEQLGRPYRMLINSDFMRVPEVRPVALPIDFSGTPEATETNVRTRREARRLLQDGITIVVFPGGGVATAEQPFGKAEELPWKSFTARLVQRAQAAVLPVYFEGQNSALFHLVSRYSLSLRLALLVSEFRYCVGASIRTHVGEVVPFAALEARADRNLLTEELYARVHRLAPGAAGRSLGELKARPAHARRQFPWDKRR